MIKELENKFGKNTILQAYGCLKKKELLAGFDLKNGSELILESLESFSEYHCDNEKDNPSPERMYYLYLLVKPFKTCTEDQFIRITQNIKKTFDKDFDAFPGQLTLFNVIQSCIRIRTKDTTILSELITAYKAHGIHFMSHKPVMPYTGMVRIKKYFELEKFDDGIYLNRENKNFKFFRIPEEPEWTVFESITEALKSKSEYSQYRFALTAIHSAEGFEDYVRVFSDKCNLAQLSKLQSDLTNEFDEALFITTQ